jgi:hypothetical protein
MSEDIIKLRPEDIEDDVSLKLDSADEGIIKLKPEDIEEDIPQFTESPTQDKQSLTPPIPGEDSYLARLDKGVYSAYNLLADAFHFNQFLSQTVGKYGTPELMVTAVSQVMPEDVKKDMQNRYQLIADYFTRKAEAKLEENGPFPVDIEINSVGDFITQLPEVFLENLPMLGVFAASMLGGPGLSITTGTSIAGGSSLRATEEYEKNTGTVVPVWQKAATSITVGVIDAALEYVGLKSMGAVGRQAEGALANIANKYLQKLAQGGVAVVTEAMTEGVQEINQILAEWITTGQLPPNIGKRLLNVIHGGVAIGVGGSTLSGTFGYIGESVKPKPGLIGQYAQAMQSKNVEEAGRIQQQIMEKDLINISVDEEGKLKFSPLSVEQMEEMILKMKQTSVELTGEIGKTVEPEVGQLETTPPMQPAQPEVIQPELEVVQPEALVGEVQKGTTVKEPEQMELIEASISETLKPEKVLESEKVESEIVTERQEVKNKITTGFYINPTPNGSLLPGLRVNKDDNIEPHSVEVTGEHNLKQTLLEQKASIKNKLTRTIIERLIPFIPDDALWHTYADSDSNIGGSYDPKSGVILINTKEGKLDILTNPLYLFHETVHALTLNTFFKDKNTLTENEATFAKEIKSLQGQVAIALEQYFKLKPKATKYKGIPKDFVLNMMLRNEIEFISYALSDIQFQTALKSLEFVGENKPKTYWSLFLEKVRKLLNLTEQPGFINALDKVLSVTDQYFYSQVEKKQVLKEEKIKDLPTTDSKSDKNYSQQTIPVKVKTTKEKLFLEWARTQIDQQKLLKDFLEQNRVKPEKLPAINSGKKINEDVHGKASDNSKEVPYVKSKLVKFFTEYIWFPSFIYMRKDLGILKDQANELGLKGKERRAFIQKGLPMNTGTMGEPWKLGHQIVSAGMMLDHTIREYTQWLNKLSYGAKKEELVHSREAIEYAYLAKDKSLTEQERQTAEEHLTQLLMKYPGLKNSVLGTEGYGGIIELFEYVKKRYQDSQRNHLKMKFNPEINLIIDKVVQSARGKQSNSVNLEEIKTLLTKLNIEDMVRETYKKSKKADWDELKEKQKKLKRASFKSHLATKIFKASNEILTIDKWGLKNYITNIELGSYRIIDSDGHTVGFGKNVKEARRKAFDLRAEAARAGLPEPKYEITQNFSPIKPTTAREKEGLKGYSNLFEVLPRYVYAMEKRIQYEPLMDDFKRAQKKHPDVFTEDVKRIMQAQFDAVLGNKYSFSDQIFDEYIAIPMGWETGMFSTGLTKVRKVTANLLLGYRQVASLINITSGFGQTWSVVGNTYYAKASEAVRTGKYTNSFGRIVDISKVLNRIEEKGLLGIDFAVNSDGSISTRTPLWKPLGTFALAEKFIRPHAFAANYIYQLEVLGKTDFEAETAALENMYFQQGIYNIAALPHMLRSPMGRTIGMFRSYMINQIQFMSTLRGKQIARFVGVQLALAGPRGVLYTLKSIPLFGALGLLDDLEEWFVKEETNPITGMAKRGIGGLVGTDITGAATMQFPDRPEDWGGPILGKMVQLFKDVVFPGLAVGVGAITGKPAPAYVSDAGINWLQSLSPMSYYLNDLLEGTLFWESDIEVNDLNDGYALLRDKLQRPNIWIRDSNGNKAYQIGGLQDRVLLGLGAAPIKKSEYKVLKNIWQRNAKIMQENRNKWYSKVVKSLLDGRGLTKDLVQDGILYGVDMKLIPDAYKFRQMSPQVREVLKAKLLEKADALDHFNIK